MECTKNKAEVLEESREERDRTLSVIGQRMPRRGLRGSGQMLKPPRDVEGRSVKDPSQGHNISTEVSDAESYCSQRSIPGLEGIAQGQGFNLNLTMSTEDMSGAETVERRTSLRKRPSSSLLVPKHIGSDTETEGTIVAAKVNTAVRGRRKASKAGSSKDEFLKPSPIPSDKELKEFLQSRSFRKGPKAGAVTEHAICDTGTDSDVIVMAGDISRMNAQELRAQAGEKLACILEVAKRSNNLKGEFVGRLRRSVSALGEVVDALADRSEAEETRRLRAENSRLRLEVQSCEAEVKALRRDFTEARTETASVITAAAASESRVLPANQLGAEMMEELKRSLIQTLGQMLNARFAGIEDRLLPTVSVRPPLRADAKKAAAAAAPSLPTPVPVLKRKSTSEVGKQRTSKAPKTGVTPSGAPAAGSSISSGIPAASVAAASPTIPQVETWAKVVKRGRKKRNPNPPPKVPEAALKVAAAAPAARDRRAKPGPKAPALRPVASKAKPKPRMVLMSPKTAAVVLSLQPEAAERGITYCTILRMAQEKIDIRELGIDQLRFHQTATGARMLEILGSQNEEKADRLAERLRDVLSEVAHIVRPFKSSDVRIRGLDETATKEGVAAAVALAGGCDVRLVKAGEVHLDPDGSGSTLVSCPISAAKVLREKGRLLIGWSSARVVTLGTRPMRCFKCLGLGHTRPLCPSSSDRQNLCFRCGDTGHRAANCRRSASHCVICAESGRPSGHIMGGRSCVPPSTRGINLAIRAKSVAKTKATTASARHSVCEGAAMSD